MDEELQTGTNLLMQKDVLIYNYMVCTGIQNPMCLSNNDSK